MCTNTAVYGNLENNNTEIIGYQFYCKPYCNRNERVVESFAF